MNNLVFNTLSNPLNVKITDGSSSVSVINDSIESIDIVHAEIHEGNHFTANHFYSAVANDAYADMHIVTGSTKSVHLIIVIQTEAKSYVNFYRGFTYSAIGTAVTIYNNNEISTNTTQSHVYYAPTVTATDVLLFQDFTPASTGPKPIGGNLSSRNEWILKPSTDYLIRVQNKGGSGVTSDTTITFMYYEIVM